MDNSSLLDHIKLIYTFATKAHEWQSLARKVHVHFARNTLKLFVAVSIISYILSGKSLQNILVILAVHSVSLYFMKEKTIIFMKIFSVITCLGIPVVRFYSVGKETALYNHIHISIACFAIFLFTDSYAITTCSLIYVGFFARLNSQFILQEITTSPQNFQDTIKYFLGHFHIIIILIWIIVSLFTYQKQVLLAQLWKRDQEKEILLREVQKKNQELEELSQSRTKLLLSLSHEFRNPINAALGNLELASEKLHDSIVHQHLVNCKVSIEMLFHLVSNLLDSTKLEAGILELNPLPKESKAIFHKVWSIAKNLLDKQNLVGEFYIDRRIPEIMNVDSHIIIKVLLNLILNAIKYTQNGAVMVIITWIDEIVLQEANFKPSKIFYAKFMNTFAKKKSLTNDRLNIQRFPTQNSTLTRMTEESDSECEIPTERFTDDNESVLFNSRLINQPSIRLIETFQNVAKNYEKLANKQMNTAIPAQSSRISRTATQTKGFLKFEVFDTGCGIKDEVAKNMFQKFSSVSPGAQDRLGLGLGLWLTKKLCEAIGGQVQAYSEKDKGSQFIALIPAETLDPLQIQEMLRINPLNDKKPLSKLRALVVDDDKYNREISIAFLAKTDVVVQAEAVNGQEAVDILTSKPQDYFDFVLMDLEMPIMGGKEAIRRIRQFETKNGRSPIKVVICTGNCDLSEYSECMNKSGDIKADFFYRKPLIKKDFEEIVRAIQNLKLGHKPPDLLEDL